MRRPNKHHPKLPPRLARYNQLIARRRAAVETTFATWKRRMGLTAIRYLGEEHIKDCIRVCQAAQLPLPPPKLKLKQ